MPTPTPHGFLSCCTLLRHIRSLQPRLQLLRKLLYPIFSAWRRHNLTAVDHQFGFYHLDLLRDELDEVEKRLSVAAHRAARTKEFDVKH